ncbi:putative Mg2+ transporter-C (MgtC) family protein [Chitinophaga ginsengisoli]|uniref:Putative Mg2+ transporter-C (MgtC) family protein n=2 Tax=Chitinophaga ginsengisoli TaxID=363837 RepID=A0A2P8G0Y1_9BACT|nr:putative Mg2+ transporter-C (MgtC) family protein [Chitinophaga ginsengisoli]
MRMEQSIFQVIEEHQLLKVLVALAVGGALGLEREYRHKAAGMRTLALICMGSTLFTMFSVELGFPSSPDRVASNILTGVGFIGAGVIFKGDYTIDGITTAATIWIAAALGIGIGVSHYLLVGFTLVIVFALLIGLKVLEGKIGEIRQKRIYTVGYHMDLYGPDEIAAIFKRFNLQYKMLLHTRNEAFIIEDKYEVAGKQDEIAAINTFLMSDKNIHHFSVQTNPL